jgi:hypothetical protein
MPRSDRMPFVLVPLLHSAGSAVVFAVIAAILAVTLGVRTTGRTLEDIGRSVSSSSGGGPRTPGG